MRFEELAAAVAASGGVLIGPKSHGKGAVWKVAHRTTSTEYVVAEVVIDEAGNVDRWEALSGAPVVLVHLFRVLGDPDAEEGGAS